MRHKLEISRFAAALVVAALGLVPLAGCSDDGFSPFGALSGKSKSIKGGGKGGKGGGKSGGPDGGLDDGDGTGSKYTKTIDNSGANFQVKDVNLLRASAVSCMGSEDMIKVTDEMIIKAGPDLADGKIKFLAASAYKAGDDIVLKLRGDLVDPESAARTSTAADGVTDTYLRALESIANVVAHNCSLDNEFCQCDETDKMRKIISRCIPGIDPETKEVDMVATRLAETCAEGAKGMREAIATLLSSYAFAAAR